MAPAFVADTRRHDRGAGRLTTSTARQGLPFFWVIFKHALRNAIVLVALAADAQLGYLLGGSVVGETIFALDRLGYLALQSIAYKDFPVMQLIVPRCPCCMCC